MRIAKRPQTSPFALDGGAAMVVTATERAADLRQRRVFISAVPEGDPDSPGSITQRPDMTSLGVGKAAARAFRMAGDTHPDIDVVWIYDCFTYAVIRQLEDMGFCAKGEGGPFVQNGGLKLGGALPTNTHGGLLSQAHVWGLNHVVDYLIKVETTMWPRYSRCSGPARASYARLCLTRSSAISRSL